MVIPIFEKAAISLMHRIFTSLIPANMLLNSVRRALKSHWKPFLLVLAQWHDGAVTRVRLVS